MPTEYSIANKSTKIDEKKVMKKEKLHFAATSFVYWWLFWYANRVLTYNAHIYLVPGLSIHFSTHIPAKSYAFKMREKNVRSILIWQPVW